MNRPFAAWNRNENQLLFNLHESWGQRLMWMHPASFASSISKQNRLNSYQFVAIAIQMRLNLNANRYRLECAFFFKPLIPNIINLHMRSVHCFIRVECRLQVFNIPSHSPMYASQVADSLINFMRFSFLRRCWRLRMNHTDIWIELRHTHCTRARETYGASARTFTEYSTRKKLSCTIFVVVFFEMKINTFANNKIIANK